MLLERSRLTTALGATSGYRALIVCGPVGSGKTTAVRHYLSRLKNAAAYMRLSSSSSLESVDQIFEYADGAREIAVDDVDSAPAEVVDALIERIVNGSDACRFILIGRSRSRVRAHHLVASGAAAAVDAATLSFSHEEVERLAARLGADYDEEAVAQLAHETDGWATAVTWVLRDAATARRSLSGAVERWLDGPAHLLLEMLNAVHERDGRAFAEFKNALRSGAPASQEELEAFESLGFPILRTRMSYRPYRILSRLLGPEEPAESPIEQSPAGMPSMTLNVLASFHCEIGGRQIAFRRRRDRNVLTFVALSPEGRATRNDVIAAFWPDADRALATQSLRTAISQIRVAIADVVGADAVDDYFTSLDDLRVNFDRVTFDVRRFLENVRHGNIEFAREATRSAELFFTSAERLYRGSLMSAEAMEPCFVGKADELEGLFVEMLLNRVQLHADEGDYDNARAYACKVFDRTQDEGLRMRAMSAFEAKKATSA